ncbi:MAG: hypothetical protein KKA42_08750 [candidate division Zixibacteria bacterium]|nr:hypothetical protein [candidate division Zixibacteria bacterium]
MARLRILCYKIVVFSIVLLLAAATGANGDTCCIGSRGNVQLEPDCSTADQSVDIADLTDLIDHLFINFTPLCCHKEADVAPLEVPDGSIDVADITGLIDYLFINYPDLPSCETPPPVGTLVDRSECKYQKAVDRESPDLNGFTCLAVAWDGVSTLSVTHVNANLNCCPILEPVITVNDTLILIDEVELEGLCDCMCLFDLDYEITGLPSAVYRLLLREHYLPEGLPVLDMMLDLAAPMVDTLCLPRAHYPYQ